MAGAHLSPSQIRNAFKEAGLVPGDLLMLHADAMAAAQLPPAPTEERLEVLLSSLEEVLGSQGTLVMPTFTYSFTKDEVFDPARSPSTVGMLTEYFRTRPGVLRSQDPLFSVAAKGLLAGEIAALNSDECFGPDSFFSWLHDQNAKLGFLGCSLSVATMVHFVERQVGVSYRRDKIFKGQAVKPDGGFIRREMIYYARELDDANICDLSYLEKILRSTGQMTQATLGRVALQIVSAKDFCGRSRELLMQNQRALTRGGVREILEQEI